MSVADPSPTASRPGAALPLAAVAVLYTVAQLALVVPGSYLGWDETVYISQVGGNAPAAFFSAPRARGISYLVAPAASLTASVTVLRVYLALLSGLGLFVALWAWRRLLPSSVLAWAGALFTGLWITLFYGPEAMPNLWSALACLTAVGCFLRTVTGGRTNPLRPCAGMAAATAVAAMMRPADGGVLAAVLFTAAVAVPRRRHLPGVWAGLAGGTVVGLAPWIAEARTDYGGLLARLERASQIQGGMGGHIALDDQLVSLQGWLLCRPCTASWTQPVTGLWWLALPVFVACGVRLAVRAGRTIPVVLAAATGTALALPYLFTIDYAAPRFLLPAYALLALPVAECVRRVFHHPAANTRRLLVAATLAALLGHQAIQISVLHRAVARQRASGEQLTAAAERLHRLGVRPPCTVSGVDAIRLAYYAGCASRQIGGHDGSITPAGLRRLARHRPVAYTTSASLGPTRPTYTQQWQSAELPMRDYTARVSPSARTQRTGNTHTPQQRTADDRPPLPAENPSG
ncbi:hypothetical protein [Streptomyces sp. TR06-5]|uniref:hypothetical protein n=1 Tax=Streptomyces sp. TR06-5 TaxID=3385976 RepID=UPI0039A0DF9B